MGIPNFKNRTLFHGDNLLFLRGINSETIDLIATDPPFNKGRDFHATPDSLAAGAKFQDRWSWADDVEGEWVDQITDDWPNVMTVINAARESYGDDMGAFLCFMGVRLLEMRRVLRSTGSIYLHCDPTASHYLKQLMDAVFGKRNFQNEIVWHYRRWTGQAKRFQRLHDNILFYSKSSTDRTFNVQYDPYTKKSLKRKQHYHTRIKGDDVYVTSIDARGVRAGDVWQIPVLNSQSKERTGYPTQKPLELYELLVKASSTTGDVVLDPFAGCATTPIAAERLGRQWIGMDIWDGAYEVVIQRLNDSRQLLNDIPPEMSLVGVPPQRTDSGEAATPYLQVTEKYAEPGGTKMSRAEMYEHLLAQYGSKCQGCDRTFDDSRYLELDHNTPRSDGGLNHISNRILLCSPCNRAKSNTYTLSGLRKVNKKNDWMAKR